MKWSTVLLLSVLQLLAAKPGQYYRNNVHRYNRFVPQKRQDTGVSLYPRCQSDYTVLAISVVDKSGKPVGKSKLWISSSTGMIETWTDQNGDAQLTVTGCQVGVVVWRKGQQSKYELVNLEECTEKTQKIVVQMNVACNFLVRIGGAKVEFPVERVEDFQKSARISYVISTGGIISSGIVTGGDLTSPLCVSVKEGDDLYMVVTSQISRNTNTLYLTDIKEGGDAWVAAPLPIPVEVEWSLIVTTNIWNYDPGSEISNGGLSSFACALQSIDGNIGPQEYYFTTTVFSVDKDISNLYMVFGKITSLYIKGNAVLHDWKGNVKIVKFSDEPLHPEGGWWILGCYKGCLDTFMEISAVLDHVPQREDLLDNCRMK